MQNVARKSRIPINWLLWLLAIPLLFWVLRELPVDEIGGVLQQLMGWQIGLLVVLNLLILLLMSFRWKIITDALGYPIPLWSFFIYRIASFGISYFTPGPQFGGEPVQVLVLQRKHAVPTPGAVSSVFFDKLLEVLVNFTFLLFGILFILMTGIFPGTIPGWSAIFFAGLLVFPALHLLALSRKSYPLTNLLSKLSFSGAASSWKNKTFLTVSQAENQISQLMVDKPVSFLLAAALSALIWVLMGVEYWLMLYFCGFEVNITGVLSAFIASRLAFLMPLPGGLGALEASQVLALQAIGFTPAAGITISLMMRARDVLIGAAGLLAGGWFWKK